MKILVTGATNGMGKGVAKVLAGIDKQAHELILLCRSELLGEATIRELANSTLNSRISMIYCDLASLADVRAAIDDIRAKHEFLDCIFINAGLGYAPVRVETADGMDPHFQVNYLSQFMLTLNLLSLLQKSDAGGRVVFNVTRGGEILWDDMQMLRKWSYMKGISQAMRAKRMLIVSLHELFKNAGAGELSFIGFEISKTVWSNQVNIIPASMKAMALVMKFFGSFISIEKCGEIIAPLFTESREESLRKSGKFLTRKGREFIELKKEEMIFSREELDKLWKLSLDLCNDETTFKISDSLKNTNNVNSIQRPY